MALYAIGDFHLSFQADKSMNRFGSVWRKHEEKIQKYMNKRIRREMERLQQSFDAAVADGYRKFIMFLHYPPTSVIETDSAFTRIAEKYHVEHVVYSHCHGESRFHDSIRGEYHGIHYHLVSGDFLKFRPERIL